MPQVFTALINLCLASFVVPETNTQREGEFAAVFRGYLRLFGSRDFVCYAVCGGVAVSGICAFIGAAPFILVQQLGRPFHEVSFYLLLTIVGMAIGNFGATRLISHVKAGRIIAAGVTFLCAGSLLLFVAAAAHRLSLPITLASVLTFTFGAGVIAPVALAEALSVNPAVAGSGSGLWGFAQMALGALCTTLAGLVSSDRALGAGAMMFAAALLAVVCFLLTQRSRRRT
jgi:DHA1 family bicyclomycin/chloramphenicol resistance-like MFS transporter